MTGDAHVHVIPVGCACCDSTCRFVHGEADNSRPISVPVPPEHPLHGVGPNMVVGATRCGHWHPSACAVAGSHCSLLQLCSAALAVLQQHAG